MFIELFLIPTFSIAIGRTLNQGADSIVCLYYLPRLPAMKMTSSCIFREGVSSLFPVRYAPSFSVTFLFSPCSCQDQGNNFPFVVLLLGFPGPPSLVILLGISAPGNGRFVYISLSSCLTDTPRRARVFSYFPLVPPRAACCRFTTFFPCSPNTCCFHQLGKRTLVTVEILIAENDSSPFYNPGDLVVDSFSRSGHPFMNGRILCLRTGFRSQGTHAYSFIG